MSVIGKLKRIVSNDTDGNRVDFTNVECEDCGHTFRTAKDIERVSCPECLSQETTATDH